MLMLFIVVIGYYVLMDSVLFDLIVDLFMKLNEFWKVGFLLLGS